MRETQHCSLNAKMRTVRWRQHCNFWNLQLSVNVPGIRASGAAGSDWQSLQPHWIQPLGTVEPKIEWYDRRWGSFDFQGNIPSSCAPRDSIWNRFKIFAFLECAVFRWHLFISRSPTSYASVPVSEARFISSESEKKKQKGKSLALPA